MTPESSPKPDHALTFARMAGLALATAIVLAAVGYGPTVALAGPTGVRGMFIGIGAALLGAWIGSLIPVLFISTDPRVFLNGILLGLAARFGISLGAALLLRALDVAPASPLLLWVGIGQVALLATDTVTLLRLVRNLTWESKS